jgi:hypothetical protein
MHKARGKRGLFLGKEWGLEAEQSHHPIHSESPASSLDGESDSPKRSRFPRTRPRRRCSPMGVLILRKTRPPGWCAPTRESINTPRDPLLKAPSGTEMDRPSSPFYEAIGREVMRYLRLSDNEPKGFSTGTKQWRANMTRLGV